MVFAIFPDIPDVDELISGQRREGVFSGLFSFLRKVGSGLALSIVPLSIGIAGYVKPVQTIINGQMKLIEQPQTEAVITTIRVLFGILPIALACTALIICVMYPVTREAHARLRTYLDKRRAGETGPEMDAEAAWLKQKLL
jgi:oligogalacturonide transporter